MKKFSKDKIIKPIVELRNLTKSFGSVNILENLNLKINEGEFLTILGPSGCGKTTVLRLIGGFEWPTRGEILIHNIDVKDLPAHKRPTSTIFQNYGLFNHLNVRDNILYGLKIKKVFKDNINHNLKLKLDELLIEWEEKAQSKIEFLLEEQRKIENIIVELKNELLRNQNNNSKFILKKILFLKNKHYVKSMQNKVDDLDFKISYWENYVSLNKTIFENKHLKRKITKKEMELKLKKMLKLVHLENHDNKKIDELSGGMKQRVALARSLILEPKIILLDEPFSALDLKVRQKLQRELKDIQKKLKMTCIFVTHDQEEALTMSDKVVVMLNGRILQYGTPEEIYDFPKNIFVSRFIGDSNIFHSKLISKNEFVFLNETYKVNFLGEKNKKINIIIRPEDIYFTNQKEKVKISGEIVNKVYKGQIYHYYVKTKKGVFEIKSTHDEVNSKDVYLTWNDDAIWGMKQDAY